MVKLQHAFYLWEPAGLCDAVELRAAEDMGIVVAARVLAAYRDEAENRQTSYSVKLNPPCGCFLRT